MLAEGLEGRQLPRDCVHLTIIAQEIECLRMCQKKPASVSLLLQTGPKGLKNNPRLFLSVAAVLLAVTSLVTLVNPLHRGLRGSYFWGANLSREPNLITREKKVGLERLRLEYPRRTARISILWEGSIHISTPRAFSFSLTSGPNSRFQVDGRTLISGPPEGIETRAAEIDLKPGFHPIQILFFQVPEEGGFDFRWAPAGEPLRGLESALVFAETPRSAAALTIFRIRRILLPLLLLASGLILWMFLTGRGRFDTGMGPRCLPRSDFQKGLGLLAFLLLNGFVLNAFLSLFCETTVLDFSRFFITSPVHSGEDSWRQIANALDYLASPHSRTLYAEVFFARKNKFQYPPTSLLLLEPLRGLPYPKMVQAANLVSWLAIVVSAFFLALILGKGLPRPPNEEAFPSSDKTIRLVLGFGFSLTFYPLLKSFEVGQIQTWLYFFFVLSLWAWLSGKKFLSGVFIGLICLIKPQLGLFALWGLLRGERRFTAGVAGAAGIVGAISLIQFGWANHLDYLRALAYMAKHGESYCANQSVNGLLNRLLFNGTNLHGNPHAFAPFNSWVYILTLASTFGLIGAALFWKGGRNRRAGNVDFLVAAVSFTVASPIAWEHHYGVLLPIFAAALPLVMADGGRRWRIGTLAGAFLLTSNIYPPVNLLANTRLNFLQSHLFFGALALLVLLYGLRNGRPDPAVDPGLVS
jgi:alpha-1,2-mannosyltransferase